jgi:putative tryptophan/tyrosine transport system substrate-binding protein
MRTRREFITLLGGAAAWPLAARAQQPAMPVVGFMHIQSPEREGGEYAARFRQGLNEAGFIEGQNVAVEYRWAQGHYDRLPGLAADLVGRNVDVIAATGGEPSPQVAKAATQTIPIVFTSNGDPVRGGLVASLNRPGGNATGVTIFGASAVTKRLQLLHDLLPHVAVFGFLMNPNHPNSDAEMKAAETAARSIGKAMLIFSASSQSEIEAAFAKMVQQQVGALIGGSDTFLSERRETIVSLAAQYRIPAIYYVRAFAEDGGLMAYGNSVADMYLLVGKYVGRILKGEKPADLPVQESTKFELVINLKTAKALGIDIPTSMQLLADEVIE